MKNKMGKKWIALLTCLAALMALAAPCLAEEASPVGAWTLTAMGSDGVMMDPSMLGLTMIMTLQEDGTATIDVGVEVEEAAWTTDGANVVVTDADGEAMILVLQEDGTLRAEDEGSVMIFSRQDLEGVAQVELPAKEGVLQDVALEDFNGDWVATHGSVMGQEASLEALGLEMSASIDNGSVTLISNGEGGTTSASLQGNALIMEEVGNMMPIYLNEDGALLLTMNLGGMTVDIIFARAE